MAATIAEQLEPLLREWAANVTAAAARDVLDAAQVQFVPVAEGTLRDSGRLEQVAETTWSISFDDVGFTDEGPVAHPIEGDPLLVFDWPEAGLFPAFFRRVFWRPGPGVEANKGWFSERAVTEDSWLAALIDAAEAWDLGG